MTIKDCIDIVDNIKPNQYTVREKVMWLSFLDKVIIDDVLKTHEGYDGRYDSFEGYTEDKLSVTLIVPSPYDEVYTAYLKMKIDGENGETAKYNNSMVLYNTYMLKYRKYYNKTHMPLGNGKFKLSKVSVNQVGLSDAEYENLKRDLTFILTEYFGDAVSEDKLYGIVTSYVQNNSEMLKGKDGHTPIKGVDYWTDADKAEFFEYADEILKNAKTYTDKALADAKKYIDDKLSNIDELTKCLTKTSIANREQLSLGENYGIKTIKITLREDAYEGGYVKLYLYKEDYSYVYIDTPVDTIGESFIVREDSANIDPEFLEAMRSGDVYYINTHGSTQEFFNCDIEAEYYASPSVAIGNVDSKVGDIDAALDEILAIQNGILGVSE